MILQALTNYYDASDPRQDYPAWLGYDKGFLWDRARYRGPSSAALPFATRNFQGKKAGPCAPGFSDAREGEKVI